MIIIVISTLLHVSTTLLLSVSICIDSFFSLLVSKIKLHYEMYELFCPME